MKLIDPSIEILTPLDGEAILKHIELCGRVCYKSEDKITEDSAERFVKALITNGHESVLEHFSFSVRFICDRATSHEIVRHRIASYSQESTRYCNYSDEMEFIIPRWYDKNRPIDKYRECYFSALLEEAEKAYNNILKHGGTPEQARAVLPNALKTELIMTTNLREWRHFLKLRTAKNAHPDIRFLANSLLKELHEQIPVIFDDIEVTA